MMGRRITWAAAAAASCPAEFPRRPKLRYATRAPRLGKEDQDETHCSCCGYSCWTDRCRCRLRGLARQPGRGLRRQPHELTWPRARCPAAPGACDAATGSETVAMEVQVARLCRRRRGRPVGLDRLRHQLARHADGRTRQRRARLPHGRPQAAADRRSLAGRRRTLFRLGSGRRGGARCAGGAAGAGRGGGAARDQRRWRTNVACAG